VAVEEAFPCVGVFDSFRAEAVGGPLHVGEEMGGLHGGDDAFFFEAVEVTGGDYLGVFDAVAEVGRFGVEQVAGNESAVGGWAVVSIGQGGAEGGDAGNVLGDSEGVEGDGVGAVADGVEAKLEASGGAFGGHLVEFGLIVAGEAGVAGVVGVGFVHGGGAGAEGAVHEALELSEVQAKIVRWVACTALLKDFDRLVEVHPLCNTDR